MNCINCGGSDVTCTVALVTIVAICNDCGAEWRN